MLAAVAAPDGYGADTAAEILATGGNAIDAAVAVAFTLAVTYPEAGNLGGGGFATVFVNGKSYFLDYRECAPASASRDMYLDAAGNVVPGPVPLASAQRAYRALSRVCGSCIAGSAHQPGIKSLRLPFDMRMRAFA